MRWFTWYDEEIGETRLLPWVSWLACAAITLPSYAWLISLIW